MTSLAFLLNLTWASLWADTLPCQQGKQDFDWQQAKQQQRRPTHCIDSQALSKDAMAWLEKKIAVSLRLSLSQAGNVITILRNDDITANDDDHPFMTE